MKTVGVADLKKNLMQFLSEAANGEPITIILQEHKMVQLSPLEDTMGGARAALKHVGKTAIVGDVLSSLDEDWEGTN